MRRFSAQLLCAALAGGAFAVPAAHAKTSKKITNPAELRTDYIARLQEQPITASTHTVGSLWSLGDTSDLSSDYKARKLNDTVVILVSVQTSAAQSGDVNSARAFGTSSARSGQTQVTTLRACRMDTAR